jgi:dienelactone hydrolase
MSLEGFQETSFTYDGRTRPVYRRGEGPGIVVMHELPGITPQVADFACRVSSEGFTTFLPVLFGKPGKPISRSYLAGQMLRVCISREFRLLARNQPSPITDWLRALCRHAYSECGRPGIGAVGMCLTGGFALSLMVDPCVLAPVLSQPSLPLPVTSSRRAALGISPEQLDTAKRRAAEGCDVLGLRFTQDPACPAERFATLRRELGPHFHGIEIDSSPENPFGIDPSAHMVLTTDFVDAEGHPTREALNRVLAFFHERLRAS